MRFRTLLILWRVQKREVVSGRESDQQSKLVFLLIGLEVFLLLSSNRGEEGKGSYIFIEEVSLICF